MQVSKYNASGNDFVIFHTFNKANRSNLAKKICHRQEGIGADGLVVLVPHNHHDFEWEFYNSDGSEASMCGNASRATAHYAFHNNLAGEKMRFLTGAGIIHAEVCDEIVQSQMVEAKKLSEPVDAFGSTWYFYDTGVPHLVAKVANLEESWNEDVIKKMRHTYNANVNLVLQKDNALHVRTFERGVEGETLACGTGMVACFLSLLENSFLQEKSITVYPKSGEKLEVKQENNSLFLKGCVKKVFETNFHV